MIIFNALSVENGLPKFRFQNPVRNISIFIPLYIYQLNLLFVISSYLKMQLNLD